MQKNYVLAKGTPYPLGVMICEDRVNFAAVMNTKEECGIVLYERNNRRKKVKIPFSAAAKTGNIRCAALEGLNIDRYVYNFYIGDREFVDPYARAISGDKLLYSDFYKEAFDWEGDRPLRLAYEKSVFYLLHVKGFTRHRRSGVEHKGTFRGMIEKIPYMKELGVTTLELMPAYEFQEQEQPEGETSQSLPSYMLERYKNVKKVTEGPQTAENAAAIQKKRINFWGYKRGFYFMPKRSYAAGKDAAAEFKELVKELHKNGMELVMQFYFPKEIKQGFILEVLKFWILEYHIDGIHVKGERIPITLLATEPLFGDTKILYEQLPLDQIYAPSEQPAYRNLAFYRDDFMYDMRRFLKGDDNLLQAFTYYLTRNPQKAGTINFITNYYGFSLQDLVSYDRKHNEENGEDNRDGIDDNCSWNCGSEGRNRKRSVEQLRLRQMKNAMIFVILSQGTPLLRAGDEFCHTQKGNNNPYCQDNDITWLNWENLETKKEFFQFVRKLIRIRQEHPVFSREGELKMTDFLSCGYPDLSYHSEEAWRARPEGGGHQLGVMYCGEYALKQDGKADDFFYIAYNLHWQKHEFALPKLPEGREWELLLSSEPQMEGAEAVPEGNKTKKAGNKLVVELPARTVSIYIGRQSNTK